MCKGYKMFSASLFCFIIFNYSILYAQGTHSAVNNHNKITFYFKLNHIDFNSSYMSNMKAIEQFDSIIYRTNRLTTIDTLKITASASPEGKYVNNVRLAQGRVLSFKQMLQSRYPMLGRTEITTGYYVTGWDKLKELIQYDLDVPYRDEVIEILDKDVDIETTGLLLQKIAAGEPWQYIVRKHLPYLRGSDISIQITPHKWHRTDSLQYSRPNKISANLNIEDPHTEVKKIRLYTPLPNSELVRKVLFAAKTNLLSDALTALNFEAEVPIRNRWSVAGEWMFPWWITKDNGNALEILSGSIEGRYWLGSDAARSNRQLLTGHFLGLYGGGGLYDLQYKNNGYQGEFYNAGISYGYGLRLSDHFNMEFSLGLGYLSTDYRYYEGEQDNKYLVWQNNGHSNWIGPTKLKISFVWLVSYKKKK